MFSSNFWNLGLATAVTLSVFGATGCVAAVDSGEGSESELGTVENALAGNLANPSQSQVSVIGKPTKYIASCTGLNFDDVPDGTVIDTQYAGVTFSCLNCTNGTGDVFARSWAPGNVPQTNVISLWRTGMPIFDATIAHPYPTPGPYDGGGYVLARFTSDMSSVSVNATPVPHAGNGPGIPTGHPFIQTFDVNGHYLDTQTDPLNEGDANYDHPFTISSSKPGIRMMVMSSSVVGWGDLAVSAVFDNLTFCK